MVRRCKNPIAFKHIQNGAAAIPIETNTEEHDYSLLILKEGIWLHIDIAMDTIETLR